MRTRLRRSLSVLSLSAAAFAAACGRATGEQAPRQQPVTSAAPAETREAREIARIVFIDLEEACACDRRRIEGSWTALQAALGDASGIAVERIHRDTQEDEAGPYMRLRPLMVVPGVYFLDEGGAVIEMLQGEVTEEQARRALGSGS
jgi:hypothetical protein